MKTSRRDFLTRTLGTSALLSLGPSIPQFLAAASAQAAESKRSGDNVLVVVQLAGGNDGINTVVPYADPEYKKNRFALALDKGQLLKIDDHVGFHPSLKGLSGLLEKGRLSILQGIGYPNPDRSHFASMDIWHTARLEPTRRTEGWVGRYLDANAKRDGRDTPCLHLGSERQPLAVLARDIRVPSVRSLDNFKIELGGDEALARAVSATATAQRAAGNELLGFLKTSNEAALVSSKQVHDALKRYDTPVAYPGSSLAEQLKLVAQLIDAGMSTRIYYLSLDGFDTHSDQGEAHAALLTEWGSAVGAFVEDLAHHGHADRVMVMSFSEFGRRVKENASAGTDHGAAAPMFLAGGKVKPGLIGKHPSMTDLDDGDLKFHTDFRQVYAGILEDWLGCDSAAILGKQFAKVPVLAKKA